MNMPVDAASLEVAKIGNFGGLMPRQPLGTLGVGVGNSVVASVEADGSLILRRSDDECGQQMAAAPTVTARRTRAPRELAE